MADAWAQAVARLQALGGTLVPDFDFAPFAETAVLLYGAAFVAERYAGELSGSTTRLPHHARGHCTAQAPTTCLPRLFIPFTSS